MIFIRVMPEIIIRDFTHLGMLWRAISQVKAKGNRSSGKRKRIIVVFLIPMGVCGGSALIILNVQDNCKREDKMERFNHAEF